MRLLYGVGINDADYTVKPKDAPRCLIYSRWSNMINLAKEMGLIVRAVKYR